MEQTNRLNNPTPIWDEIVQHAHNISNWISSIFDQAANFQVPEFIHNIALIFICAFLWALVQLFIESRAPKD